MRFGAREPGAFKRHPRLIAAVELLALVAAVAVLVFATMMITLAAMVRVLA